MINCFDIEESSLCIWVNSTGALVHAPFFVKIQLPNSLSRPGPTPTLKRGIACTIALNKSLWESASWEMKVRLLSKDIFFMILNFSQYCTFPVTFIIIYFLWGWGGLQVMVYKLWWLLRALTYQNCKSFVLKAVFRITLKLKSLLTNRPTEGTFSV